MFHLNIDAYPTTPDALRAALADALGKRFQLPGGSSPVEIAGPNLKAIESLTISLDDAAVRIGALPDFAGAVTDRQTAVYVRRFSLSGHPIRYESARAELSVTAADAGFDFGRDSSGVVQLVLAAAREGHVSASIAKADLETVLLAVAKPAAAAKGVKVEKIELSLNASGPRSVDLEARIAVRKLMSAAIRVVGHVELDDALTATVSGLRATSEGMAGGMVVGFIQPTLERYNGQHFPLTAFSLGDLRLREVRVATSNGLQIEAVLGS